MGNPRSRDPSDRTSAFSAVRFSASIASPRRAAGRFVTKASNVSTEPKLSPAVRNSAIALALFFYARRYRERHDNVSRFSFNRMYNLVPKIVPFSLIYCLRASACRRGRKSAMPRASLAYRTYSYILILSSEIRQIFRTRGPNRAYAYTYRCIFL